jgi:hypothetical protein
VALLEKLGMPLGVAALYAHAHIPVVGNTYQMRIERPAQAAEQVR